MKAINRILAIDIGAGTQDILLYDTGITPENCISMILPAPTRRYIQMIDRCDRDIFISGDAIGGGGIASALSRHRARGYRVTMTEEAAYTLRNNLEEVLNYGVVIGNKQPDDSFQTCSMIFDEFDWPHIKMFLSFFQESGTIDLVAVAVQDHGVPPETVSNRAFRFKMIEQRLHQDNRLEAFVFRLDDIPDCYKRMKAVASKAHLQCKCDVVAMDTCFAAVLGCLEEQRSALAVNVGNSHTIAAAITDGRITGLLEHHTGCLTAQTFDVLLERFIRGDITSEEVLNDGGHGVALLESGGIDIAQPIMVTGPKRDLLKKSGLNIQFAAPHGSMMLTGPFGLVKGAYHVYSESNGIIHS
jgi:uncharacterized protein (DUF1786 family)